MGKGQERGRLLVGEEIWGTAETGSGGGYRYALGAFVVRDSLSRCNAMFDAVYV